MIQFLADTITKSRKCIRFLFQVLIMVPVAGCSTQESSETLSRVTAPDSIVDAVLVRYGGDATVTFSYEVYIVPRGAAVPGHEFSSFGATDVTGLKLIWEAPRILGVEYSQAAIYQFRNAASSRDIKVAGYTVELRLRPTSDRSLPES